MTLKTEQFLPVRESGSPFLGNGAGDEIRTHDSHLGKVVLYQLSYAREERPLKIHFPLIKSTENSAETLPGLILFSYRSFTSSSGHCCSFRCKVRRLIPSSFAALVRFPLASAKASRRSRFSFSSLSKGDTTFSSPSIDRVSPRNFDSRS